MLRTVEYWLDLGVDGLRLDAVPYLFEREGTSCENLPETHEFLKELRRHVDARFDDRMLLAEANQWPEDAIAYFGDADECHMAFHFPLMPRLFMGLRMEDRFPIIDILRQTPPIPEKTQWAVFLRNHDELTLEMVTDEERDYMYRTYAHDPVMRINLGIRRRLAPLLHNNRQKIELMHGLLCSLPGTPVLYYGDEIGMGDNVYLGDRDGVRTPMQWSADRNAGFSRSNPQRLFLPVIIDPEYNYETVNVAAQLDNPESLLWWVRRLIALRKRYPVFGHGSLELLAPDNHRVLAFLRRERSRPMSKLSQQVLVVANLSRHPQYVELDLSEFRGHASDRAVRADVVPADRRTSRTSSHSGHTRSTGSRSSRRGRTRATTEMPVLPSLRAPGAWDSLFDRERPRRARRRAPACVAQRGDGSVPRDGGSPPASIDDLAEVPLPFLWHEDEDFDRPRPARLAFVRVEYLDGEPDIYVLPIAFVPGSAGERLVEEHPAAVLALVQPAVGEPGVLVDAHWLPGYGHALISMLARRRRLRTEQGSIAGGAEPERVTRIGECGGRRPSRAGTARRAVEHVVAVRREGDLQDDAPPANSARTRKWRSAVRSPNAPTSRTRRRSRECWSSATERGATPARRSPSRTTSCRTRAMRTRGFPKRSRCSSRMPSPCPRTIVGPAPSGSKSSISSIAKCPSTSLRTRAAALPRRSCSGGASASCTARSRRSATTAFAPEPMNALALRSTYQSMRNRAQQALRALRRSDRIPEPARADVAFVLDHVDEPPRPARRRHAGAGRVGASGSTATCTSAKCSTRDATS